MADTIADSNLDNAAMASPSTPSTPSSSTQKKRMGYYNAQQESDHDSDSMPPPDYFSCATNRRRPPIHSRPEEGSESLPLYTCTVSAYACVGLKVERTTPFETVTDATWENVFLSLRGTMLCVYTAKVPNTSLLRRLASRTKHTLMPGEMKRIYSLQHGCVGVASDVPKTDMIPKHEHWKSFSEVTLAKLREREPDMFYHVKQYCLRLRLEGEQMLIRFRSREQHVTWMTRLCESIDLSPALEDRGEPLLQTCPRRARRADDLQRAIALSLEEPEGEHEPRPELDTPTNGPSSVSQPDPERELEQLMQQIHYSMGTWPDAGDLPRLTPVNSNTLSNDVQLSSVKPTPQNEEDTAQFHRRAPPSLLFDSPYASRITLKDGKLWLADHETETLIPHGVTPPAYEEERRLVRPQTLELLNALAEGSSDSISSTISVSSSGQIVQASVSKPGSNKSGSTWSLRSKNRSRSNTTSSKRDNPFHDLNDEEMRQLRRQLDSMKVLGVS